MGLLGDAFKIGGSLLGGGSSSKAAKQAAEAQKEVARMNNELAREFRRENTANLSPYMNRGNVAGAYINALLGLPGAEYTTQAPAQPMQGGNALQGNFWGLVGNIMNGGGTAQPNAMQGVTTKVTPVSAQKAFNTFRNSTGYQFRLGEGMDALNQGYAAKGALRSGAAQKDFMRFGQGIASDEFGRYLGYLGGQQGTGLSGASAIAGVGNTALNAMTQNNQNAADAASNSALLRGTANQQMWAGIGNSLGNMFSSSFGGMNQSNINRISGDVQNTLNTNSSIF